MGWLDRIKPNTQSLACTRFQSNVMTIWRQFWDDIGKWDHAHFLKCFFKDDFFIFFFKFL
jgi:hypothetical protein